MQLEQITVDGQIFEEIPEEIAKTLDTAEEKVYTLGVEKLELEISKRIDKIENDETLFKFAKKVMKHLDRRFPEHNIDMPHLKSVLMKMFFDNKIQVNQAFKVIK